MQGLCLHTSDLQATDRDHEGPDEDVGPKWPGHDACCWVLEAGHESILKILDSFRSIKLTRLYSTTLRSANLLGDKAWSTSFLHRLRCPDKFQRTKPQTNAFIDGRQRLHPKTTCGPDLLQNGNKGPFTGSTTSCCRKGRHPQRRTYAFQIHAPEAGNLQHDPSQFGVV